ncbi:MAG: Gfo/Idh/MocA family oxidoreductase [Sedimentisphaerales bacterium]|nr:Gfo/Idh/MocA family oxidoreductase [Sedimentisphaerales bacterium]
MKPIRNRRGFLKDTARLALGALGFPALVPARVLGQGAQPGANDTITIGCIGVGSRGRGNLLNLLQDNRCRVLAVCDVDAQHRDLAQAAVNRHYGNRDCGAANDFRELIARPDIDAVLIATPDHWHALIAVAAARAGKDIYGEKPLALTITQGRAMVEAVRRYGVVFQTGTQQRSDGRFRRACELVRNGRIGTVHTVEVEVPGSMSCDGFYPDSVPAGFDYDLWLGPAPQAPYSYKRINAFGWRWIFDYAGGCVTDWGAHHMDIAQWGLGATHTGPVAVEGTGFFPPDGLYNTAVHWRFVCTYANNVKVVCFARKELDPRYFPNGVKFIGSDGWVYVDRGTIAAEPARLLDETIGPEEIHLYESSDHYRNFIDCVRSRRPPAAPIEEAHRSVTCCHLANIAMRLGRRIRWDPDTETILQDPQASRLLSRPLCNGWSL